MTDRNASPERVLNRDSIRQLDRRAIEEYGLPGIVLMENAGRGVAHELARLSPPGRALICCGRGNNGGEGLVIARHLDLMGFEPRVMLWGSPESLTPDAAINLRVIERAGLPIATIAEGHDAARLDSEIERADWVVDSLLGTGFRGVPRSPLAKVIERLNASGRPILAVDVPSGLDCDTGQAAGQAIRARLTCTFVARKPGFDAPGSREYTGEVHVVDIGAPRRLIEEIVAASKLPLTDPGS